MHSYVNKNEWLVVWIQLQIPDILSQKHNMNKLIQELYSQVKFAHL